MDSPIHNKDASIVRQVVKIPSTKDVWNIIHQFRMQIERDLKLILDIKRSYYSQSKNLQSVSEDHALASLSQQ